MDRLCLYNGTTACGRPARVQDCLSPAKSIEFNLIALAYDFHMLLLYFLGLCQFFVGSGLGQGSHNRGTAAERVSPRLILGLFYFSYRSYLIEIALEHGSIWDVFCRFGELQQDDARTDLEEAHDDSNDLQWCALEPLKQDRRGDNRRRGEEDIVGGCYQGGIEEVQGFLGKGKHRAHASEANVDLR